MRIPIAQGCPVSLARTNKGVHVHNERNFPQAKLDSKINVRFLLNEHGDLYFLLHNNSVHIILFNLKRLKIIYWTEKKDILTLDESEHKTGILWDAKYDRENNHYTNALRPRRFK